MGESAFVFTDIEGSTELWDTEPELMRVALELHNQILSKSFAQNGKIFKTVGDAFCVQFGNVSDAVAAVNSAHNGIINATWPTPRPIRVRWAIHFGDAIEKDGDYFGTTLNANSRILGLAHPDQVLISESAANSDPIVEARFLGHYTLRGIRDRVGICQLLGLGETKTFPPLRGTPNFKTNLTRFVTEIIGKEAELDQISDKLKNHRWVSFCGPAGVGKTRLATEIGWRELDRFPDGVYFVDLSKLPDDDDPESEILRRMELNQDFAQATQSIAFHRRLLILDNCEHMIAPATRVIRELLARTQFLTILSTSRQALGGNGESVLRAVPFTADTEAIELLGARGKDARSDFTIPPSEQEVAVKLVNLLDRVPLAIEFAAARLAAFDLQTLYESLVEDLAGLDSPDVTAVDRQASLTGMIHWSYRLLPPEAQGVLNRLSVFRGGFNLVAARYVAHGEFEESSVPRWIEVLVRSSLIQFDPSSRRYRLLESVRDFAQAKLESWGEAEQVQDRFLRWLVNLAEESRPHLDGPDHARWIGILEQEHANVRAALTANSDPELRLRVAVALHQFWLRAGHVREGRAWVEGTLRRLNPDPTLLMCQAYSMVGILAWSTNDLDSAEHFLTQCMHKAEALGAKIEIAKAASNLGLIKAGRNQTEVALEHLILARDLYQSLGDAERYHKTLNNIGNLMLILNDPRSAIPYFEAVEDYERINGNRVVALTARSNRLEGQLQLDPQVDLRGEIVDVLEERIALADRLGASYALALLLIAQPLMQIEFRVEILGFIEESRLSGYKESPFVANWLTDVRERIRDQMSDEIFQEHLQTGKIVCQNREWDRVKKWLVN